MEVLKAVIKKILGKKDQLKISDQKICDDLDVSTEDERPPTMRKVIYSIIIVCFSTFFFGIFLSSSKFLPENFGERGMIINNVNFMNNQKMCITQNLMGTAIIKTLNISLDKQNVCYMNGSMGNGSSTEKIFVSTINEESWFRSSIFLGAFFGNVVISSFHLNRKKVIMNNNLVYFFGAMMLYYSTSVTQIIISKFILGLASGISFAYVPAYLTELKIYEKAGLIGSFQFMLVTIGVELGYLLAICFKNHRLWGFILICIFILAHSISLIFVLDTKSTKNGKNIKSLFENRDSGKSFIMCCVFHLAQQASGVNVDLFCDSIIRKNNIIENPFRLYLIGITQLLPNIITMLFVDFYGRRPFMIVSVAGVMISLSFMAFSDSIELRMYLFTFFYSYGLGPITWFITGEVVPLEYRNAMNQIATSINWLSAFIAVWTQDYLLSALGISMFKIHLCFMCIYFIYLKGFFQETKGRIPSFL